MSSRFRFDIVRGNRRKGREPEETPLHCCYFTDGAADVEARVQRGLGGLEPSLQQLPAAVRQWYIQDLVEVVSVARAIVSASTGAFGPCAAPHGLYRFIIFVAWQMIDVFLSRQQTVAYLELCVEPPQPTCTLKWDDTA